MHYFQLILYKNTTAFCFQLFKKSFQTFVNQNVKFKICIWKKLPAAICSLLKFVVRELKKNVVFRIYLLFNIIFICFIFGFNSPSAVSWSIGGLASSAPAWKPFDNLNDFKHLNLLLSRFLVIFLSGFLLNIYTTLQYDANC